MIAAAKSLNLLLAFLLELAMLAAFGLWAYGQAGGGWMGALAAIVIVAVAVAIWAIWGAPRSSRRLAGAALVVFKLVLFGMAALALAAVGQTGLALVFAVLAVVNLGLAQVWGQA